MVKQKGFAVNIFENKEDTSIKSAAKINFLSLLTRRENFESSTYSYTNILRKKKLKGMLYCEKQGCRFN